MPVTTDDRPGPLLEEEVQFEDRTSDGNPTVDGAVRFVSDDLVVKTAAGVKSLTEAADGGLTETEHKTLRHLIHFIANGGPGDTFSPEVYREQDDSIFPTQIIWYDGTDKANKIFEKLIERSAGAATNIKPTPITWKIYDTDGSTVLAQAVDTVAYSGASEINRTRTFTLYGDAMGHKDFPVGDRHGLQDWSVADATARAAISTNLAVGKVAHQQDDDSFWIIQSLSPTVWAQIDGGGGSGETNTASNQGTDGVGVYDTKVGADLQFRHVAPGSTKITTTLNSKDIDVDVVPANIKLDDLGTPDDNTDLNSTETEHGLLPKLGGGTTDFLRADGAWKPPIDSLESKIDWFDDFPGITFCDAWEIGGVGGGSAAIISDRATVAEAYSGSADGDSGYFSARDQFLPSLGVTFRARFKFNTTSSVDFRFGFESAGGSYVRIELDTADSSYYRCKNYDTTSAETTTTAVTPDTDWHTAEIVMTASSIVYKVDGATLATHTTYIPTEHLRPSFRARARSAADKRLGVDWCRVQMTRES